MSSAPLTEWRGRSRPVEVDVLLGFPVDRTICPVCMGQPENIGCKVCGDKPVCPRCRGARQVSMPGPRVLYRACEGCTYASGDFDHQLQWEGFSTSSDRLAGTLNQYRAANPHRTPPPVIDPWTNYGEESGDAGRSSPAVDSGSVLGEGQ